MQGRIRRSPKLCPSDTDGSPIRFSRTRARGYLTSIKFLIFTSVIPSTLRMASWTICFRKNESTVPRRTTCVGSLSRNTFCRLRCGWLRRALSRRWSKGADCTIGSVTREGSLGTDNREQRESATTGENGCDSGIETRGIYFRRTYCRTDHEVRRRHPSLQLASDFPALKLRKTMKLRGSVMPGNELTKLGGLRRIYRLAEKRPCWVDFRLEYNTGDSL